MRYTLVFLMAFLNASALDAQDWNTIYSFPQAQTVKDILFLDTDNVYACSALYNGTALNIKKSTDGGFNWEEQYSGFTSNSFRGLATFDGSEIFAIGNEGALVRNNGGDSWTAVDVGLDTPMRSIQLVSAQVGYLGTDGGVILKTEDGGDSWNDLNGTFEGVGGTVVDFHFFNENDGFMIGWGMLQYTNDGGLNWQQTQVSIDALTLNLTDIHFVNDELGFVVGHWDEVLKTTDGGDTWNFFPCVTDGQLLSVDFIDENIGFACGWDGSIVQTADGGETWQTMTSDVSELFHSIDFYGNRGLIATQTGSFLEYAMPVSVEEFGKDDYTLFPNPVNDSVQIQGDFNQVEDIQILDLEGRIHHAGSFPADGKIACEELSSGTYVLRMKLAGDRYVSRSFIKQ